MKHYPKYALVLILIALIAFDSFAQERLEKALHAAKDVKLTLGAKELAAAADKNQLSLKLYLNNVRIVAEPVMGARLAFNTPESQIVKHTSSKYLSIKEANRLRNLQQLYFNGYHPYPMHWKELSSLTPRYRFNF